MHKLASSFALAYHGCDQAVANKLLDGEDFKASRNDYDWLGDGIYFWEANPQRGVEFAQELRNLDCAVINLLHKIRRDNVDPSIDTVRGVFVEGGPAFENSGFYEKTHIQICVREPECIKGVFRVPKRFLE